MNFTCQNINEEEMEKEKMKFTKLLVKKFESIGGICYYQYFSSSEKIGRPVDRILSFRYNFSDSKKNSEEN